MENAMLIIWVSLLCLVGFNECYYGGRDFNPMKLLRHELLEQISADVSTWVTTFSLETHAGLSRPVYVGPQEGVREVDKIGSLPGQPGYVTVDAEAGRALFYYFVESPPHVSSTKPLVLWLNGGPGCSSIGNGAMMELGPFRVKNDGKTLNPNKYAWNKEANIIFLESPAGVGFSYSNRTSDYKLSGDTRTAQDSYTFLINWLERFPEYKTRDFFITGESYAGHYIPQLAQTILQNNKYTNQTIINLKGIAIGNAYIDFETTMKGAVDFFWTHALMSDEIYNGLASTCDFSKPNLSSKLCLGFVDQANDAAGNIYTYDIYAPLCNSSSTSNSVSKTKMVSGFDPCSKNYVHSYLNNPEVQKALHANVTALPYPWQSCSGEVNRNWKDKPLTVLPIIKEVMESGVSVWIYSGDTDGALPVTCSRYAINKLGTPIKTAWYPWYTQGEVGGYAVGYQNLTFVTVRGAGHFVPSYQPARALGNQIDNVNWLIESRKSSNPRPVSWAQLDDQGGESHNSPVYVGSQKGVDAS
ncbi:hypothetical protein REPUB_Repub19eG0040000 [Reevesia pubescens]